jgi:hypothetical protein
LREQHIDPADGVRIAGHALGAAILPLDHQSGTFQHGHVLLHGRKRHLVSRGQFTDGRVGVEHPRQDVPTGGIGQRTEELVQVVRRRLSTYNHMVVDSSMPDSSRS